MKQKIFTLFLSLVAGVSMASAAITVRLDPESCNSWRKVYLWAWYAKGNVFAEWPGKEITKNEDGWYSYTFDSSISLVNIIWTDGTYQTVDITGITSSTDYALDSQYGTKITASIIHRRVLIGNLYYNLYDNYITGDQTAVVTYKSYSDYSYNKNWTISKADIPLQVTYNNTTYNVTSIGKCAFKDCNSLASVIIPNSVTSIERSAISGCTVLASIEIAKGNPSYCSEDGAIFNKDKTKLIAYLPGKQGTYVIPNSVTSIDASAFSGCTGLTSVTIPNSVTSIGEYAFSNCTNLTSVTIPNSVTSIRYGAFYKCFNMTSLTIPNSVTSIESQAFYWCNNLTSVTIPNSVTSIKENAFFKVPNIIYSGTATGSPWGARSMNGYVEGWLVYRDNTKASLLACFTSASGNITIPNSVTDIGDDAFIHCKGLTSVNIPNSVTSIGSYAFGYCSGLTSVNIPNSVTSIGSSAFYDCKGLTSVAIPNSVTSIGETTFSGCAGLASVNIPSSVRSIGHYAFQNCKSLTSVTIPDGVISLGSGVFLLCWGLESVIIGSSVTSIGYGAFDGCGGIKSVYNYRANPAELDEYGFSSVDATLYVLEKSVNAYKSSNWAKYFKEIIPIGSTSTDTNDLTIDASTTSANFVWPAVSGAATYELVIKDKNGNVICTLTFNAQGQLTSIAFNTPAHKNESLQTQSAGFAFTVTGLEPGTQYNYSIIAKNESGATLNTETGTFTTKVLDALENTAVNGETSRKFLRNGQVYILRGDKIFNASGQQLK